MGEVIYKQAKMRKQDFYAFLKQLFIDSGWIEISSREADGQVFFSPGESGQDELYVNLKEWQSSATASNMLSGGGSQLMVRTLLGYTPGAKGGAGVFKAPALTWGDCRIGDSANVMLDVIYYGDKDKVTFFTRRPSILDNYTCYYYLGKPIYFADGMESKYAICLTSFVDDVENARHPYNEYTRDNWAMTTVMNNNPKAQNASGELVLNELTFSDNGTNFGMFCKIDGIYVMTRDAKIMPYTYDKFDDIELEIGDRKYKTILLRTTSSSWQSLPYFAMAYRVE